MPEPQAQSAARAALLGKVRAWNAARQREAQACVNGVAGPANGQAPGAVAANYQSQVTVHWDTATLFSLAWRQASLCPVRGGPIGANVTDVHVEGIVFDATTGQRYDPRRLYPGPLQQRYFDRLLAAPQESDLDADCVDRLRAYRNRAPLLAIHYVVLARDGLMMDPDTPRGQDPVFDCLQAATLPYASIRDLLDPKEAARLHWNP